MSSCVIGLCALILNQQSDFLIDMLFCMLVGKAGQTELVAEHPRGQAVMERPEASRERTQMHAELGESRTPSPQLGSNFTDLAGGKALLSFLPISILPTWHQRAWPPSHNSESSVRMLMAVLTSVRITRELLSLISPASARPAKPNVYHGMNALTVNFDICYGKMLDK